jgi:exopolyphosphatase/guanosine-5'-triphosphate,3'-diphosphate pyrophosphatase
MSLFMALLSHENGTSRPVGVVDIGSNSIRLVVYEALSRVPVSIYNEKVLSGLGKGLGETGMLADDSVSSALAALSRYRVLAERMGVEQLLPVATAAVREAGNGPDFIYKAEMLLKAPVRILSGEDEARLAALGVVSGMADPDGIVGDLGGGSLELIDIRQNKLTHGETLGLGGIRLKDMAGCDVSKAATLARQALKDTRNIKKLKGRSFYMIGGTWRSLARLFMRQTYYPLNVMHNFKMKPAEASAFCQQFLKKNIKAIDHIDVVSSNRQGLLPYGAMVLKELVTLGKPKELIVSAFGLREGLLYEKLDEAEQQKDPLLKACRQLAALRSRSLDHAQELPGWTDQLFEALEWKETPHQRRLRHAACYLADIGWRAHPDYRGEQSLNIISHAAFIQVDHQDRVFMALSNYYRHIYQDDSGIAPGILRLIDEDMHNSARFLGSALRLAYVLSAAMPGVLPLTRFEVKKKTLKLILPEQLQHLSGERPGKRFMQMARMIGYQAEIEIRG